MMISFNSISILSLSLGLNLKSYMDLLLIWVHLPPKHNSPKINYIYQRANPIASTGKTCHFQQHAVVSPWLLSLLIIYWLASMATMEMKRQMGEWETSISMSSFPHPKSPSFLSLLPKPSTTPSHALVYSQGPNII